MKAILFFTLLFLTISIRTYSQTGGKVFGAAGMTKRTTVTATDELLIKGAGNSASQYTTPVELFNSAQAQSKFLSKTDVLPLTNYMNYASAATTGDIAIWLNDSVIGRLSGGTTGQVPAKQSSTKVAFSTVSGTGTAPLFAEVLTTQNITSQSLVDITSLSLTLDANSLYLVEYQLNCNVSADVAGAGFSLFTSTTTDVNIDGSIYGSGSATSMANGLIGSSDQSRSGYLTDSGMYGTVYFKGTVETATVPVTIKARGLKTTSGTLSVWSRSYIIATKVR